MNPPLNPIPIHPARWDWPSAIGSFLLSFGTLDYLVFLKLKDHLPAEEFQRVQKLHLRDRLTRIASLLQEAGTPEAEQTRVARLIERLEPIRELRNHIAHGHLLVSLEPETNELFVSLFLSKHAGDSSTAGARRLRFEDLRNSLAELDALIADFSILAGFPADKSDSGRIWGQKQYPSSC